MKTLRNLILCAGVAGLCQVNGSALACAACYGTSDSPMAQGMNAGILTLLGIIGTVLCGAATFFVFLARRASTSAKAHQNLKVDE
jgi:hypothetical protein